MVSEISSAAITTRVGTAKPIMRNENELTVPVTANSLQQRRDSTQSHRVLSAIKEKSSDEKTI